MFVNNVQMTTLVWNKKEEILMYFLKTKVIEFEDIESYYKIGFYFAENLYFKIHSSH